jgi:uncharacterized protein YkwD
MTGTFGRIFLVAVGLGIAGSGVAQWRHFGDSSTAQAAPAVNRPVASSGLQLSPMAADMVSLHNAVRKRVGVGPIAWSDELAGVAQEWANRLIANGQFVHSQNANYGENLFEIQGAAATPNMVVKAWADEAPDYNYTANACVGSKMCGHYTQMVWGDTKQVGCAKAKSGPREVWVCEYNPPGNWEGKRPY